MSEPLQAVVRAGVVEQVIVCSQDVADMFQAMDPPVFPDARLYDVTDLLVGGQGVAIAWTYDADRDPAFRPAQPSEEATWNEDTHQWDEPAPQPDPTPEPDPEPTASAAGSADATTSGSAGSSSSGV